MWKSAKWENPERHVKLSPCLGLGKFGMKEELTIGLLFPTYIPAAEPANGTLDTVKLPGNGFDPEKGFALKGEL